MLPTHTPLFCYQLQEFYKHKFGAKEVPKPEAPKPKEKKAAEGKKKVEETPKKVEVCACSTRCTWTAWMNPGSLRSANTGARVCREPTSLPP